MISQTVTQQKRGGAFINKPLWKQKSCRIVTLLVEALPAAVLVAESDQYPPTVSSFVLKKGVHHLTTSENQKNKKKTTQNEVTEQSQQGQKRGLEHLTLFCLD